MRRSSHYHGVCGEKGRFFVLGATWIVAYCGCPHHLSGIVVDELRRRGYAHAAVLDEGINEWHRRGLPVVAAEGVTKLAPEAALPAGTIR